MLVVVARLQNPLWSLSAISKWIRTLKTFFSAKKAILRSEIGLGACQQCRFATIDFATGTVWPALWTHLTYCVVYRHNAMVGISVEPLTVIEGLTPAAQVSFSDRTLNWLSQAWFRCSMVWWSTARLIYLYDLVADRSFQRFFVYGIQPEDAWKPFQLLLKVTEHKTNSGFFMHSTSNAKSEWNIFFLSFFM